MANDQLIDQVISPATTDQVTTLTKLLSDLDIQMVNDIKSANQLNSALSNTKSFSDYNKSATQTAIQLEKIQQAQNKTAQTTVQLNNVQAKAAADQQARDEKAALALAKKQAAQASADAKEIANAEAKAAKLAAIQKEADNQARKARVEFPTVTERPNPVTEDTGTVNYRPIITGEEDMSASRIKSTEAIAAENAALLEQQEVLGSLTTEQRANIETLLALQAERAANAAELKALNVEDAVSGERAVFLTAEQLKLKVAIAGVSLELNRQTKEQLAQSGSITELNARLDQLVTGYDALSEEQRKNIEIGGVWLDEIQLLKTEIIELEAETLRHGKSVGDYTNAINKSSAGMELSDKIATKFTSTMIRMGVQFILITVALGAITWLAKWVSGLDAITGRLDKAKQAWLAWSEVMAEGNKNAAKGVIELEVLNKAAQDNNLTEKERIAAAEKMKSLWPEKLKNMSDEVIMNGKIKGTIDEITASIEKEALAEAGLKKLTEIEGKELDLKTQRDKLNYIKAGQLAAAAKSPFGGKVVQGFSGAGEAGGTTGNAVSLVDQIKSDIDKQQAAINASMGVLENTKKIIEDNIGTGDLAKAVEKTAKTKKGPKDKDFDNTDLLEFNRIRLEEAKKTAKLIMDDENQSFATRKAALQVYIKASQDLIKNSNDILDKDTNMRKQQRINKKEELKNALLDIDREEAAQRLKIQKDNLAKLLEASKENEQDQIEILDNGGKLALRALTEVKDSKINQIDLQYAQGKVKEKDYQQQLLDIQDQFAIDRITHEIATQSAILGIKEGERDSTAFQMKQKGATPEEIAKFVSGANKGIQPTKDKLSDLGNALINANAKKDIDDTTFATKEAAEKRAKIEQAAHDLLIEGIDSVDKLRQKAFEQEIARLEKLGEKIDENANNEKTQVQNSIVSNATKVREIAVIDAQAAAQHKALQAQINKEKHQQDIAEKEAVIAKIIINGALAIVKSLADGPFVIALTAAGVGLELATAIATPLPQYAKGTKNYPGGLGIWGEAGIERATLPDGSVQYSNGAAIANFPKGTVITPHMELMQQIRPEPIKYTGGEQIGWGEVLAQLKKMESKPAKNIIRVTVDGGFEAYKRQYLNR